MIKQFSLALLTTILTFSAISQERKDLTLSIAGGKLACPYYANNRSGRFFSFDFDYSLSVRHALSVNYTDGEHRYFDNVHAFGTGGSINADGTNAEAAYHTFSVLYKYTFLNSTHISATVGTGVGIMTH